MGSADDDLLQVPDALVRESTGLLERLPELGKTIASEVAEEVTKGASKGTAGLISTAMRTVARIILRQFRSSKAHLRFEREWSRARDRAARETVVRRLLQLDPKLSANVADLLHRRDYLLAMEAHCERLAFFELILPGVRTSDVYVDPMLRVGANVGRGLRRASKVLSSLFCNDSERRSHDNYLLFGEVGGGKTTLIRHLIAQCCRDLLGDAAQIDSRALILPVYLKATDLNCKRPFIEAVHGAVEVALGAQLVAPLPAAFFDHQRDGGMRRWLIVIDGVDEIKPAAARLPLLEAVRGIATRYPAYRFVLTCNDRTLAVDLLGEKFQVAHLQPSSGSDVKTLVGKYRAALDQSQLDGSLDLAGTLTTVPRIPMYIAMAAPPSFAFHSYTSSDFALCTGRMEYEPSPRSTTSNCWLVAPFAVYCNILAPSAVLLAATSIVKPLRADTMV